MRIIKRATLAAYWEQNRQAKTGLLYWHKLAKAARWTCLPEVRATFPHADPVRVASGRTVTVFNIGDMYRLITAIHYDRRLVFTLIVLTHPEYDKQKWKKVL